MAKTTRDKQLRRRSRTEKRVPESQRTPPAAQKKSRIAARAETPFIELYQKESCPFSHRVRGCLTDLGLDFVAHTVPDGNELKHQQLVNAGGKDQIPFLVDHRGGTKLYETEAIIKYLQHEYGNERSENPAIRVVKSLDRQVRGRMDQLQWVIRRPIDRIFDIRREAQDAVETARGTLRVVRGIVEKAVSQARRETRNDRRAA